MDVCHMQTNFVNESAELEPQRKRLLLRNVLKGPGDNGLLIVVIGGAFATVVLLITFEILRRLCPAVYDHR
jgi:hypothetical protein